MRVDPPRDRPIKYESPPWKVFADGYLLNIKPHLHDGGLNFTFYVNGENKCFSEAVYGNSNGGSGLEINGDKYVSQEIVKVLKSVAGKRLFHIPNAPKKSKSRLATILP